MDQNDDESNTQEIREEQRFLYEKLLKNLEQERGIQQSLLDLLEEERTALSLASADAIEKINTRKESLILKEKGNAATRRDIIDRLGDLWGRQIREVTLSGLADMACDENQAVKLRVHQQCLTKMANATRMNNCRNRALIHAALEDVQSSLHLIQSMVAQGGSYQKTGQLSMQAMQGSLIHREG